MALVFLSYSHADFEFRNQLEKHLAMLKRQGRIDTWHDRQIRAGESIDDTISEKIAVADIVLLLVSSDFLASDYCYGIEVKKALERHEAGKAKVVPLILRPCDWHAAPFGRLLATPTDGKPVSKWPDRDEAWLSVVESLKEVLPVASSPVLNVTDGLAATGEVSKIQTAPRSSNLRIRRHYTDAERSSFLRETFEFVARFFESSLIELRTRNQDLQFEFLRVDANKFRVKVFRHGKQASRCEVRLGDISIGFGAGIAYSNQFSQHGESYNELLSVEVDDQEMYLRPIGFGVGHRSGARDKLSQEGAAELYWAELIEPLQR